MHELQKRGTIMSGVIRFSQFSALDFDLYVFSHLKFC